MARLMLQDLPAAWAWLEWAQALGECLDEGREWCHTDRGPLWQAIDKLGQEWSEE